MQVIFPFSQTTDLRSIRERLAIHFGKIRVEDRPNPVGQLVGSFIGRRTYDWKSWDAFARLVERCQNWDAVADVEATLDGVIRPKKKTSELRQALRAICTCFGQINLDFLARYDVDLAMNCLRQIDGVGPKIAAATLNFNVLRKRTFVVDTHVLRLLRRLGFMGMSWMRIISLSSIGK